MLDFFNKSLLLNKSETPVMPKPNNSIKSPKCSKTQISDKMAPEEITTILEKLRVEMIALKSFADDQIYIMQKKSTFCETSAHCDNCKILIKSLNDQINFLKSEMLSSQWFSMIKTKWGNQNHSTIEEKTTLVTLMATTATSFRLLENRQKRKKQTPIKNRIVFKFCKMTSVKTIMI